MGGFGAAGEGLGGFGAEPGQVAQKVPEKVPGGFGAKAGQVQECSRERCFQRLTSQHASERFVEIEHCDYWGYHRC